MSTDKPTAESLAAEVAKDAIDRLAESDAKAEALREKGRRLAERFPRCRWTVEGRTS